MEDLTSKQYFEEVSEKWDDMGNDFFGNAPRSSIYDQIQLRPGMSIADIGSGSGYLLERLDPELYQLIAIDQSPQMLKAIQAKFGNQKIQTLEGTSENLPLGNDSIDIVMANMYLHHVERPSMALKEMARILKPGGTLIFTDLDKHDYDQLIEEQFDRWKGFKREDIKSWMIDAGLKDVSIDCVGSDCCTSSCDGDAIAINIFIAKGKKSMKDV